MLVSVKGPARRCTRWTQRRKFATSSLVLDGLPSLVALPTRGSRRGREQRGRRGGQGWFLSRRREIGRGGSRMEGRSAGLMGPAGLFLCRGVCEGGGAVGRWAGPTSSGPFLGPSAPGPACVYPGSGGTRDPAVKFTFRRSKAARLQPLERLSGGPAGPCEWLSPKRLAICLPRICPGRQFDHRMSRGPMERGELRAPNALAPTRGLGFVERHRILDLPRNTPSPRRGRRHGPPRSVKFGDRDWSFQSTVYELLIYMITMETKQPVPMPRAALMNFS